MRITMVKKQLASGEPCKKCIDAEQLLRARGLWSRIDNVVWAIENEPESPGMQLAAKHRVDLAPFFLVESDTGEPRVFTSTLQFIKEVLAKPEAASGPAESGVLARTAAASADE